MAYLPINKKGNPLALLAGLALALGAMYSLRTCRSGVADRRPAPSGGDTIDVAIEYSPLSFYRYGDTLGGFNYDFLRRIAKLHNLTLKFHPVVSLSQSIGYLDEGIYDIVAADIPLTAEFKDRYSYLEPVFLDKQVLVQLKDSLTGVPEVVTQLDLASDTVWIVEGSPVKSRIANLAREIGDTIHMRFDPEYGPEQLFIMTATGEIGKAVISESVAREMAPDYPMVDISTDISFTQFQSWMISPRDSVLRDSLNNWIKNYKATADYKALARRYRR